MSVCPHTDVLSRVSKRHTVLHQLRTSGDISAVSVPGVDVYWRVGITAAGQSHCDGLNNASWWIHWYWGRGDYWFCGGVNIHDINYNKWLYSGQKQQTTPCGVHQLSLMMRWILITDIVIWQLKRVILHLNLSQILISVCFSTNKERLYTMSETFTSVVFAGLDL